MKCQCCENRIWIEPSLSPKNTIEIRTKKQGGTETGIDLSFQDAKEFIEDLEKAIKDGIEVVHQKSLEDLKNVEETSS